MTHRLFRAALLAAFALLALPVLSAAAPAWAADPPSRRYYGAGVSEGSITLIDWSTVKRSGDQASALVVIANRAGEAEPGGRRHVFMTITVTFDCMGGRWRGEGLQELDEAYQPFAPPGPGFDWEAVKPGGGTANLMQIVCRPETALPGAFADGSPVDLRKAFLAGAFKAEP